MHAPLLLLSSGDPVLDRRVEWARALAERGESAAAADLLRDTLRRRPDFLAAVFLLGQVSERAGAADEAIGAYRRALALDPDDRLGARARLARLGALPANGALSRPYVQRLFDEYAGRFDAELTQGLAYRAPAMLRAALERVMSARGLHRFTHVLDLGCGTGLMGAAVRDLADRLIGVDLSPGMVAMARTKDLYDELMVADLREFMAATAASFDLILAADVFVYVDDLAAVLAEAAAKLRSSGLLAFSVETHAGAAVALNDSLRYAHSESYLRRAAAAARLEVALLEQGSTRTEKGSPVPGLLAVFVAPANLQSRRNSTLARNPLAMARNAVPSP